MQGCERPSLANSSLDVHILRLPDQAYRQRSLLGSHQQTPTWVAKRKALGESFPTHRLIKLTNKKPGGAHWKGFIKFGEVAVAVALYTAVSSSERIAFNTLNRVTGNRVRREFVDSETGDPVAREDQVKGYEVENGDF